MSVEVTRLQSGLTIVTDAMPHLKTASLGVWIGSGAIILGGVKIASHSVIAAGSVVRSDCPVAAQAGREVLSLPLYPDLREDEVDAIAAAIRAILEARAP